MKVLILRFSSIGDIVLTTPVVRCLKKQVPNIELHYATKAGFVGLLKNNPYIDKIHGLGDNQTEFIQALKTEKFDLIIDLHHNLRTLLIKLKLGVKRHAFDKINLEKWLMTFFKIDILPYTHIVDRYLETVEKLGVLNDSRGLDFFIDSDTNLEGIKLPDNYFVYAIGGQHATKKMPLNKQIELLMKIDAIVFLIGGKEDMSAGEDIHAECKHAINLCGQLSIQQSALLMRGAVEVITHDTGMMHIAAALNKSIISIWGNTIPGFGMTPYYTENGLNSVYDPIPENPKSTILQVEDLSCRPCSKIGYKKCPKGHFKCMNDLNFDSVFED